MKNKNLISAILVCFSIAFIGCKKNKDEAPAPQVDNAEEVITTLHYILKENNVLVDTFSFVDKDGVGGNNPIQETILLKTGKTYTAEILLLDETKTPSDTISNEVKEEGDEHQFFFTPSSDKFTVNTNDKDKNGVPLGLESTIVVGTQTSNTCTLKIVLKHQPGVKPSTGKGDASLGDSDIEVTFNVNIENAIVK
jgi:hypothetical protein